ncbi:MAG: MptD family putative ECF transporter S component [Actinomycetaceae bacterium]|nr:MptD family putative ECF transporter S component [Actinomycetaceae bacterium]
MKLQLTTRDLINIAIFSVIYFVIMYASGMVGFFGPAFMFVGWTIGILINGIVVMLLLARVPKVGTLALLGFIVGLGMAPGHTVWIIPGAALLGFISDLIINAGAQGNPIQPRRAIAGYAFLQLWFLIPLIPILVDSKTYYQGIESSMGKDYSTAMEALFSPTVIGIWAICLLILGAIGGYLGIKTARKHFRRAGLTR